VNAHRNQNPGLLITTTTFLRLTCTAIIAGAILSPGSMTAALGDLYTLTPSHSQILRVAPDGTKTPFATFGNASNFFAFDKAGNLYGADNGTGAVVKITPAGGKTTLTTGFDVRGLAVDSAGNVFVADLTTHSIVKVTPAGAKSTFASGFDPFDLRFDAAGNLYTVNGTGGSATKGAIYKFTPNGTKTTFAMGPAPGYRLAFDYAGNLYVASLDGMIVKFAAGGGQGTVASGLGGLTGLACDGSGNLLVVDFNAETLIKIAPSGAKTTIATTVGGGLTIEPPRGQPVNIATRLQVQTGDNALIAGFIVTGDVGKKVLIRGLGPSLASFGIAGALQDPRIELRNATGAFVNANDNWKSVQQTSIQETGLAPADDRESALLITLGPGAWTVVMRGGGPTTGVGLVEVYDLDPAAASKLANISTRGYVQTGENVMIGGFIVGSGNGAERVIVRAIGPSLSAVGIGNALSDPTLELRTANGAVVEENDDWRVSNRFDLGVREVMATGLAPTNDRESAVVATLPNGNYTAIVAGYNGAIGVGLVEIYNLQ
jgi:hypothetical protein